MKQHGDVRTDRRNIEMRSPHHIYRGKAILHILCVCVRACVYVWFVCVCVSVCVCVCVVCV